MVYFINDGDLGWWNTVHECKLPVCYPNGNVQ